MLKKGFDLFTTSPAVIERKYFEFKEPGCCDLCTSPYMNVCKPFCKFRKATLEEWINYKLKKGVI